MEELCTGCLCAGRKLYFIGETGFSELYTQILNEIPVVDISSVCIRVCWECVAGLRRFHLFKAQVKQCYTDMLWHMPPPALPPRLVECPQPPTSYPDTALDSDSTKHEVPCEGHVKTEVEWPETFAYGISFVDNGVDGADGGPGEEVEDNMEEIEEKKITKKPKKKAKTKEKKEKVKKAKVKTKKRKAKLIKSKDIQENTIEDSVHKQKEIEDTEKILEVNDSAENLDKENTKVSQAAVRVPSLLPDKPQCVECGKMFSSRKTYRYHLNVLHKGQNRYPCPRCGKVYQWKSNLGRHLRTHKAVDAGELHCGLCNKSFASVATYRQHLRISRRHVTESDFSFTCNECGKKFVNKTRLRDHIDWEHLNNIKFRCQLCNKAYKCHTSLYVHLQNVHRNKEKKDNLCHVCGKSYQNPAKLKYHITALHTGETPYQCNQCNAAFGWYSSLYRHVREVHYKMKVQPKKSKKIKKIENEPPTYLNYPT